MAPGLRQRQLRGEGSPTTFAFPPEARVVEEVAHGAGGASGPGGTPQRTVATRGSGLLNTVHYTQFLVGQGSSCTLGDVLLLPCPKGQPGEPLLGLLLDAFEDEAKVPRCKVLAFARAPDITRVLRVMRRELKATDILEVGVPLSWCLAGWWRGLWARSPSSSTGRWRRWRRRRCNQAHALVPAVSSHPACMVLTVTG
jgi:hypothetical protein